MPKRSTFHLAISLTLLFSLFFVLPGVFIYQFGQQIFIFPTHHKRDFSPQALKRFKQKELLVKENYMVDEVSYTQEELKAGYFKNYYQEADQSVLDPELKIRSTGINISATVYIFSIPIPWPYLSTHLKRWFPVANDRIAFYARITLVNRVAIEKKKGILQPTWIKVGKKEIPHDLIFLGRIFLPGIFTKSLPGPIADVVLGEGEIVLHKQPLSEDIKKLQSVTGE